MPADRKHILSTAKPFDLEGRYKTFSLHPQIGVFDRLYEIGELTKDEVEYMGEWLSHNCTKNFIFLEMSTRIIAGGTSNHPLAWKQRNIMDRVTVRSHLLKLYNDDFAFFELSWLHGHGKVYG